jgi:YYY domain-containing protein
LLSFLLWLVAVELLGLAALPLALATLPRLADRGYGLAKVLGLLLLTYLNYLLGSVLGLGNSAPLLALGMLALFLVGLLALGRERADLAGWFRAHVAVVLLQEGIFVALFVAWTLFRAAHPAILSTEKPMDLALMTASHRATSFPPYDPWMAGRSINYYYGGYLAVGTLVTLTGVAPAVGYNLAVALLFALVGTAAYAVVYGLTRSMRWALLGPVFVLLVSNLDGLAQLLSPGHGIAGFDFFRSSRVVEPSSCGGSYCTITEFPAFSFLLGDLHPHVVALPFTILTIAVALNLALAPAAGWRALGSTELRRGLTVALAGLAVGALYVMNSWDWPTYALLCGAALLLPGLAPHAPIPAPSGHEGGDPRSGSRRDSPLPPTGRGVAIPRSAIGALRPLGEGLGLAVGVFVLSYALYFSFHRDFVPQYASFGLRAHGSPTGQVLTMFGLFLLPVAAFIVIRFPQPEGAALAATAPAPRPAVAVGAATRPEPVAPRRQRGSATVLGDGDPTPGVESEHGDGGDQDDELPRLPMPSLTRVGPGGRAGLALVGTALVLWALFGAAVGLGTAGLLFPFAAVALYLAWRAARAARAAEAFALLLCAGGIGLIMLCDALYLKDNFCAPNASGTCTGALYRMNTVFKFYYQAWTVLALGGAYGLYHLSTRRPAARVSSGWHRGVAPAAAGALAAAGLVYVLVSVFTSTTNPYTVPVAHAAPTLDGSAYLDSYGGPPAAISNAIPDDAAAIRWLQTHVAGHPTILEADQAPGNPNAPQDYWPYPGDPNQELLMSRIATFTGLPDVLGWGYAHAGLWHGDAAVTERFKDVQALYTSADPAVVGALLRKYHVGYVYVGQIEAYTYDGNDPARLRAALLRFERFGRVVYQARGVTIIRTSTAV